MKIKNIIKNISLLMLFGSFFGNILYAEGLDVIANYPSGTYDKILNIELTPTDINAKTFYSFNPNGGPNDAFLYTGAINLKKSSSLIFFSYTSTENETKIKQNDYIIKYSNDIRLLSGVTIEDGKLNNVNITNIGNSSINVGLWEIRTDSGKIIIPETTMLEPNSIYKIEGITGTGIISLFSPDEEKKDFIEGVEVIKLQENNINTNKPIKNKTSYIKKISIQNNDNTGTNENNMEENTSENINTTINKIENENISISETGENTLTGNIAIDSNITNETKKETNIENTGINEIKEETVNNSNTEEKTNNEENINNNLKNSIQESSNNQNGIFVLIIVIIFSISSGIYLKIKKNGVPKINQ